MNWFMKMWLWAKKFTLPDWLKGIFERILGYAIDILKEFTLDEISSIQSHIMLESKKDIPGTEKLENVAKYFRDTYTREDISNRALNFVIEYFVTVLTNQKFI